MNNTCMNILKFYRKYSLQPLFKILKTNYLETKKGILVRENYFNTDP
jgi:hypothetical protein